LPSQKFLLNPIYINNGTLAAGHRLKVKVMPDVKAQGVTHIITLLSQKEGALQVKKAAEANGIEWLWLPLENAQPPAAERQSEIRSIFSQWQALLAQGAYLYIHCAAGIHRTGMIAYAFLRYLTYSPTESHQFLKSLRQVTSEQVGYQRLHWGDFFAPGFTGKFLKGRLTLDDLLTINLADCVCYAHSVGEGYQYRGKLKRIDHLGSISLIDVETVSNESCDFDFTNPYSIGGDWKKYEDIEYGSSGINIELTDKGLIVDYSYAGTVYIHLNN